MPSAKEQIAKILQDQPDDSSYDEILRELAFARMIERQRAGDEQAHLAAIGSPIVGDRIYGGGGELGPSIVTRVPSRTDEELTAVIKQGLPAAGMPASPNLTDVELGDLVVGVAERPDLLLDDMPRIAFADQHAGDTCPPGAEGLSCFTEERYVLHVVIYK